MNRILLIFPGWLLVPTAHAEAGKGFYGVSQGEILRRVFLFGFGIPAVLGYILFTLLKPIKDNKPSLSVTVTLVLLAWWVGLFLLFKT
jgi:hypothetical protein